MIQLETKLEINRYLTNYLLVSDLINESEVTKNINTFCTNVLKDEKGKSVEQSDIHIAWHLHIEYCWNRGLHPIILAPWGSGKSVQIVIGLPLFWLGTHTGERIKIICNSDDNAKVRVTAIGRYITQDKDFKKYFPNVVPDPDESWTKHEMFIKRPPGVMSIDASLQAKGVFSTGIGGRIDLGLFDDIVDRRNAIEIPEQRKKLPGTFQDVWMSRLEPAARTVYIATPWHLEDNTHIIMKDPNFCTLKQEVSQDFSKIKTTIMNNSDDEHPLYKMYRKQQDIQGEYVNLPLWHEKWGKQVLIKKCGTTAMSKRSFEFGFRLRALTSTDLTFPSFRECIKHGVSPIDLVSKEWLYYTGVDLSTTKRRGNVIFTLAFNPKTNTKIPVDIRAGAWTSPEVARQLADVDKQFSPEIIMVETNAMQTSLVEWIKEYSKDFLFWDRISSYQTKGNVKRAETGLPGLETEFNNKGWIIAVEEEHSVECGCGFCTFISEMNSYPFSTTTDAIMACWFARVACKEGVAEEFYDEWEDPVEAGVFQF
jgi:hypothetical protein